MKKIVLNNVLPLIFSDILDIQSGIWENDIIFEKGSTYLIKAESGVGKSSLCSYIYGYRADYSGNILFDEEDIKTIKTAKWDQVRERHLSILFQELRLFPELTALENIHLKNNLTNHKTEAEINILFDRLGIPDKKDQLIGKMSWGQQQRVAIIRSLCQPYDFLILDEPTSHLDDKNGDIIANLISEEVQLQQAGLIVTSIGKDLPINYSQTLLL